MRSAPAALAVAMMALAGCAVPEVEIGPGSGGSGTGGSDGLMDDICNPGHAISLDAVRNGGVVIEATIDDNEADTENCQETTNEFRRAFYRFDDLDDAFNISVEVDPQGDETFLVGANDSCAISIGNFDTTTCIRSTNLGARVTLSGPANLAVIIVWGTGGPYTLSVQPD